MKLNPDCIRDILMCIEDVVTLETSYEFGEENPDDALTQYETDEILYHLRQCELSGFFYGYKRNIIGSFEVKDLTPAAHEFLANIRKDTIWNGVKSVSATVGANSLNTLIQISSNVVTELIKSHFALPI